nr:hypothetical protein [Tanacetum cinerariifolium]
MILEPSDLNRDVPVAETFHKQTDEELIENDIKDSCRTAQEIWLRIQQMMKGYDIRAQEKKAKLFNEWEKNVRNQNRLIIVLRIANQNGNGNVVAARAEGNGNGNNNSVVDYSKGRSRDPALS